MQRSQVLICLSTSTAILGQWNRDLTRSSVRSIPMWPMSSWRLFNAKALSSSGNSNWWVKVSSTCLVLYNTPCGVQWKLWKFFSPCRRRFLSHLHVINHLSDVWACSFFPSGPLEIDEGWWETLVISLHSCWVQHWSGAQDIQVRPCRWCWPQHLGPIPDKSHVVHKWLLLNLHLLSISSDCCWKVHSAG